MAITPQQFSAGTTAAALATVPPGEATVILSVPGTATVYVGLGTAVSTVNGYPVTATTSPVLIPGYASSSATALYAIASAAGTPIGVIISTGK